MSIDNLLTLLTAIILLMTMKLYKEQLEKIQFQIKEDHERSRREETMRIMRFWAESVATFPHSFTRLANIFEKLNDGVEKKLFVNGSSFNVNPEEIDFILSFLPEHHERTKEKLLIHNGRYVIDYDSALIIRRHLMSYLNVVEIVDAAWLHQIGDRRLLEKEFNVTIDGFKSLIVAFHENINLYPSAFQFVNRPRSEEKHVPTGGDNN